MGTSNIGSTATYINGDSISSGLDRIQSNTEFQKYLTGRIGYLCHSASIDKKLNHGVEIIHHICGDKLTALFAPQHGIYTDAQDNMIESPHFIHPKYQIPVFSLYSETRVPTPQMLENIDTLVIDLQDSGVRVYTYIWTMVLAMKACAEAGKRVVILDRPNPLDGITIEGNGSEPGFESFIGLHPLPMRHGMTIGEIALFAQKYWDIDLDLKLVPVHGWMRSTNPFENNQLPWVLPSPNLATLSTLRVYPGTVLFEGTNFSEGRGTARPFELFGHPDLKANQWLEQLNQTLINAGCRHIKLRPHLFVPTFEKWSGTTVHGYQVHFLNTPNTSLDQRNNPHKTEWLELRGIWYATQIIMRELNTLMGEAFRWRQPPFEYIYDLLPIDILNGTDKIRKWIESNGTNDELDRITANQIAEFLNKRKSVIIYE